MESLHSVNGRNKSERCAKVCSSQVLAITKTISPTEFRLEFPTACVYRCNKQLTG